MVGWVRADTPLQALTLMNDVTYVEAVRVLAERMLSAAAWTSVRVGFQLVMARRPASDELQKLNATLERQLAYFPAKPDAAAELVKVGKTPVAAERDVCELAAYTIVASMIFNLTKRLPRNSTCSVPATTFPDIAHRAFCIARPPDLAGLRSLAYWASRTRLPRTTKHTRCCPILPRAPNG